MSDFLTQSPLQPYDVAALYSIRILLENVEIRKPDAIWDPG